MTKKTLKQRVFSCFGLSFLTHFSLLIVTFILPSVLSTNAHGTKPEVSVDLAAQPADAKLTRTLPKKKVVTAASEDGDVGIKKALLQSRSEDDVTVASGMTSAPQARPAGPAGPAELQPQPVVEASRETVPTSATPDDSKSSDANFLKSEPQAQATQVQPIATTGQLEPSNADKKPSVETDATLAAINLPEGIRNGDDLKEIAGNPKPAYPVNARKAGHQGSVVFLGKITSEGKVEDIQLEKSSGATSLDMSAYNAFKAYHYQPGQQGLVRKTFTFALKGEAEPAPSRLRR